MSGPPALRVLVAVGLVAGSTLALQVLLTRIFSAVLFYHFGFLAISLALLGVGGGAILVYLRPALFDRLGAERSMARLSVVYAALLLVAVLVLVKLDYSYERIDPSFVATLGLACVLAALPMLAAGTVVAVAVREYVRSMGRLYAFDLAGAGLGALAVVPLMWLLPAPGLTAGLAVFAALAAALFAGELRPERLAAAAAGGAAVLVLVLSGPLGLLYVSPEDREPDAEQWTPLSRVLGYSPASPGANGLVVYDRVSGEIIPYRGGPSPGWKPLDLGPHSIGYELTGPGDALVIGGGGGRDIHNALASRQRRVDVIELNRGIRDVVDNDLADVSGRVYSLPRVSTAVGDGRSTLAQRDRDYDTVHLGFTDTVSVSSAQAFALTENNLYTVEAFDEYLDHLRPGGVLNVSRPIRQLGDEGLRVTVLAMEALRQRGVADPRKNVIVVEGDYDAPFKKIPFVTVLARNEPFTAAEVAKARRLAAERGKGLLMAPGEAGKGPWAQLSRALSIEAFCSGWSSDVCAPTDDRPFFFQTTRLGDVGSTASSDILGVPDPLLILLVTLGVLVVLSAVVLALPLALVDRRGRPPVPSLGFFAAIGLGFLLLEVVLIQRFVLFLGFPTYALSIVLFTLLVSTGLGSYLSSRARSPRKLLTAALVAVCVLAAASAFGLGPLLRAVIDAPFALRVALTVLILAPLGLALGVAMPVGLIRLERLYPRGVPWAWGVNGIASVVASVVGIAVAIVLGYPAATLLGLLCYLGALAHVLLGAWPEEATVDPESAGVLEGGAYAGHAA